MDKVYHLFFYFPLGALIFWALGRGSAGRRAAAVWAAAALAAGLYGLGLEVVQYFLPWRSFEWLDAAMDLLGGAAGAAVAAAIGSRAGGVKPSRFSS